MKTRIYAMVFIFACLLCSYVNLNAQEKYAVLITGDYAVSPEEGIPDSMLWNSFL